MNPIISLGFLALLSCVGLVASYGGMAMMGGQARYGFQGYPYGYGGLTGFGNSFGGGQAGGVFGTLIKLFVFILLIRTLFNGQSGGGNLMGLLGRRSSKPYHRS